MKIKNGSIFEETFYLGSTHIQITNPKSYFPTVLTEETKHIFLERSSQNFNDLFNELSAASRDFYKYESSFDFQKSAIQNYLQTTPNKQIIEETGLSNTTVSELKNNKKSLETSAFKTIEKLYLCAIKNQNSRITDVSL